MHVQQLKVSNTNDISIKFLKTLPYINRAAKKQHVHGIYSGNPGNSKLSKYFCF